MVQIHVQALQKLKELQDGRTLPILFISLNYVTIASFFLILCYVYFRYGFQDRVISGAITTEGKIVTHYMQLLGSMRWGLFCTVDHSTVCLCTCAQLFLMQWYLTTSLIGV